MQSYHRLLTGLSCAMLIGCGLTVPAQSPPSPTLTVSPHEDVRVYKSHYGPHDAYKICAAAWDPTGLSSLSFSSAFGSTSAQPHGATKTFLEILFFASYYPTGDYPVHVTAIGAYGQTRHNVTIHLLP